MRRIRIAVHGFDDFGMAVAGEAARQGMEVVGVVENIKERAALARATGFAVIVAREHYDAEAAVGKPSPLQSHAIWLTGEIPRNRQPVPSAEEIALRRLLAALGGPDACRRVTCLSAGRHDDRCPTGPADRLEPIFDSDTRRVSQAIGLARGGLSLHRVHVPAGGTRLCYVEIATAWDRTEAEVTECLARAVDIVLMGAPNTGLVSEHFRDRGRPRGRHHEICILRENLCVERRFVRLMAEIDPEGVRVPETFSRLRQLLCPPEAALRGKEDA